MITIRKLFRRRIAKPPTIAFGQQVRVDGLPGEWTVIAWTVTSDGRATLDLATDHGLRRFATIEEGTDAR